ncbi:MAG: response regulator [Agriterribacter sp.]
MHTRLLIVDDHYMVAEGIRSLLQHEPAFLSIDHAADAASCLQLMGRQLPDVVLMDINLPDKSGIDLCREVTTLYPSVFVIGLSTYNQQSFIEKMLQYGASGYLLKNATREELVEAIDTVQKGKIYINDEVAGILRAPEPDNVPIVTRREKEILQLIADGMTSVEIAGRLFISAATVETHRKNLVAKFNARNTVALIKAAIGYRLIE